jgi:cation transport ATPase
LVYISTVFISNDDEQTLRASSIATDIAQVVLMDGELSNLCKLFDLATSLDYQLRNCLIISIIPFPLIVGGVFWFHFGLASNLIKLDFGRVSVTQ